MQLFRQKAELETQLTQVQGEAQQYQAKLGSLGQPVAYAAPLIEQQIAAADKEASALAVEIAALNSKVGVLEQALTNYRAKVDAFKASQFK